MDSRISAAKTFQALTLNITSKRCIAPSHLAAAPALSQPATVTVAEDSGNTTIALTITDADSNPSLLTTNSTWATQRNSTSLTFQPALNFNGLHVFTVFSTDATGLTSNTVTVTVNVTAGQCRAH